MKKYPIIAVTGSSGAGTSTVKEAFQKIFVQEQIKAFLIEGDSFHKYDRKSMQEQIKIAIRERRRPPSHFGPEANLLEDLELLFATYSFFGHGYYRHYIHNEAESLVYDAPVGTFTAWEPLPSKSELLLYEGLHGAFVSSEVNIPRYVDLLIGITPTINLEWIQKIHRDTAERGHTHEEVKTTILRRMYDYVHYITPQFSKTDINFQRVPTVDTSNPFIEREIPSLDESFVVIHVRKPDLVDFPHLLTMLHGSFMSRTDTIVVPGGKMGMALELITRPIIRRIMKKYADPSLPSSPL